jgi:signal transduction histidine kinase
MNAPLLVAIVAVLVLVLLTGLDAFGPLTDQYPQADLFIFIVACLFGIAMVRYVAINARSQRRTQDVSLQLESANIKLFELSRLKSEFLSFASHQIKSPMTVIKGYATLIIDGSYGPISGQLKEVALKMKQSADRMVHLVDEFLDLRRIEEGRMEYRMEPTDLLPYVSSIVNDLHPLAEAKKLRLTLEPSPQQWTVPLDPQHMRQVLQNLIDNAIKYTEKGSVTVRIATGPSNTVRITVTDTGRGISPKLLGHLFDQFSRDPSIAKEIAGTGLGLYIARMIVQAHNGQIRATSAGPGHGSEFTVEIPAS